MQERIVILGGGIAALTAAFELTSQPGWRRRRAVTVYQMGHRLGGKGASGRNAQKLDRIEEHGLHLFYGFYDNAFGLMRRCYSELDRPAGAPLATLEEAFKPHSLVVFEDQHQGEWQHQPLLFPRNAEAPGARTPVPTLSELIPRMLRYLVTLLEEQIALRGRAEAFRELGLSEDEWNELSAGPTRDLVVLRLLCGAASALADELGALLGRRGEGSTAGRRDELLARVVAWSSRARALAAPLLDQSPGARLAWTAADVTLTMIRGMIADGLIDRDHVDWTALDHEDFRAWLRRHGASEDAVRASTVAGVYAGAYHKDREMGAGTALHWTLRMLFTYRGAMFYKMQAGMGDVVFAPLYLVLRRRGVRFRFFHRLERLRLSTDRSRVEAIDLGRQILPAGDEYEPFVDVKGLPCWPSEPLYEQLDGGEELRASGESLEDFGTRWPDRGGPLTLRAGMDFDRVVLGIGLCAVPTVCQELLEDPTNPRFARMVRSIKTTQTASVQLWLEPGHLLGARGSLDWLRSVGLDRAARLALLRDLGRTLRSGALRMVFLKQYRDAKDPTRACYQAIVEATATRRGALRRVSLLSGDLSVAVRRESGIAEPLGLQASSRSETMITTRALAALYVELDFTLAPGAVVWSAAAPSEPIRPADRRDEAPMRLVPAMPPLRISA